MNMRRWMVLGIWALSVAVMFISFSEAARAGTLGTATGTWSVKCPYAPFCTLDASFEVALGKKELFQGTYTVTGGELGCLGPNLQNVATGVGGIAAFSQQVGLQGQIQTDPVTGKTKITQYLFVLAPEFANYCANTNPNDPICANYNPNSTVAGHEVLEDFWHVGPGTGTECNTNWTSYVVFPNDWTLAGQILNCGDVNDPSTCTVKKQGNLFHCTSDLKLRDLIDDITDAASVTYNCQKLF